MTTTAIYTINGGAEIAYQKGKSRVVVSKGGAKRCEVMERGAWRASRGYLKPNHIEEVKSAVRA